jgi:radical SAM protein with 4Fe4S-binding SPASM domain
MQQLSPIPDQTSFTGLSFLWLELTNRCNLECVHCYSDSSPWSGDKDVLTKTDYLRAIDEAALAGCRGIQFIGGEPTLNHDLPELIDYAWELNYNYIEVYSNLIRLPDELIQTAQRTDTQFATSVYSSDPAVHDAVTGRSSSHARTISNIRRLIKLGIPVRAGFIETEVNAGHWESTASFLKDIGVTDVGYDITRGFGRGAASSGQCDVGELCGRCWDERLCIAPDGSVSPCIMSKAWLVGNIRDASVQQIAFSSETVETRSWLHANRGAPTEPIETLPAKRKKKRKRVCGPTASEKRQPGAKLPPGVGSAGGICRPEAPCTPDRKKPTLPEPGER